MGNKLYDETSIQAIANSIRSKTGGADAMKVSEMSAAIDGISAGGTPLKWGGMNGTLLLSKEATFDLSDTSFVVGTTAPTSATSIRASNTSDSRGVYQSISVGSDDIVVVQRIIAIPTLTDGSSTVRPVATASVGVHQFAKKQTNMSNIGTRYSRGASAVYGNNLYRYVQSSGTETVYSLSSGTGYGLYGTPATPSLSSGTSTTPTLTIGTPALYCRASSSYCSTANMKCITACTWYWRVEVYKVDAMSTLADSVFISLALMCKNLEMDRD